MAAEPLRERAAAKINLTLHVLGRRADGYHELESLVAFAGVHDVLSFAPAGSMGLSLSGPTANAAGPAEDNLVLKAARLLAEQAPDVATGHFHLLKRLPAAAGVGGGSADAAAALRLLCRASNIQPDDPRVLRAAMKTGSDVPVCLASHAQMMCGAGERISPIRPFQPVFAVLVNPGVKVDTRIAFQAFQLQPGETRGLPPHPQVDAGPMKAIASGWNDFEPSAIAQAPVIGEALETLRAQPDCMLARMTGSGATCFGLFGTCRQAAAAARRIRRDRPEWWIEPTVLR